MLYPRAVGAEQDFPDNCSFQLMQAAEVLGIGTESISSLRHHISLHIQMQRRPGEVEGQHSRGRRNGLGAAWGKEDMGLREGRQ